MLVKIINFNIIKPFCTLYSGDYSGDTEFKV